MKYLFIILLIQSCSPSSNIPNDTTSAKVTLKIKSDRQNISIQSELARTEKERERGLMFRKNLADYEGMLFIFDEETDHSFWMKNTYIPLDLIFIDTNKLIVDIIHRAEPLSDDLQRAKKPSRYVLEVPGGFSRKHSIHIGDQLDIP